MHRAFFLMEFGSFGRLVGGMGARSCGVTDEDQGVKNGV